jgi:prophage regulatory protein
MTNMQNDATNEIIDSLAARLDQVLRRGYVPPERQLWSAQDIAAYLGVSPRTVAERYAPLPDFPTPIRLPSTGQVGLKRWKASAVMQWAEERGE